MRTGRQVSAAAMRRLQKRIGQRLKARRVELGLSQDRVAKACKLSQSYLSQLEAGLRNPSIGVLYLLGKVLGVTLFDLVR